MMFTKKPKRAKLNSNVKLWVAALRSGRYKQAHPYTRSEDGESYSALGVACDLYCKDHFEVDVDIPGYAEAGIGYPFCLPPSIQDWLWLKSAYGEAGDTSLYDLNRDGKTFEEIADFIEAHWRELGVPDTWTV